jgi:hypothetical protein
MVAREFEGRCEACNHCVYQSKNTQYQVRELFFLKISSLRQQRPRYAPTIRQSITTSRRGAHITTNPAVALTIEFEGLFCRQPVPPEHNIEISPDRLGDISSNVWAEQGL